MWCGYVSALWWEQRERFPHWREPCEHGVTWNLTASGACFITARTAILLGSPGAWHDFSTLALSRMGFLHVGHRAGFQPWTPRPW